MIEHIATVALVSLTIWDIARRYFATARETDVLLRNTREEAIAAYERVDSSLVSLEADTRCNAAAIREVYDALKLTPSSDSALLADTVTRLEAAQKRNDAALIEFMKQIREVVAFSESNKKQAIAQKIEQGLRSR